MFNIKILTCFLGTLLLLEFVSCEPPQHQNNIKFKNQVTGLNDYGKEVFVFLLKCNSTTWKRMDWSKITTIALAGWVDNDLINYAHQHKAKVVFIPSTYPTHMKNSKERKEWIKNQLNYSTTHGLDGINFDFENEVGYKSMEAIGYYKLVKETSQAFKSMNEKSQISIDYGWRPGADNRMFFYKKMAKFVDIIFVMGYDTQSQMFGKGECQARANSPIKRIKRGLKKYAKLGIPPKKMILGVPWYGYRYPCEKFENGVCYIKHVPFRGCNCSDAAGIELPYKEIVELSAKALNGINWNSNAQSPYFEYSVTGKVYQVWFDNPASLYFKYQVAKENSLRGVGFWTGNFLDYSNSSQIQSMWSIVP